MKRLLVIVGFALVASACGDYSQNISHTRSLTGEDYTGQKFYLGWGAAYRSDPQMMHNEVRYDVQHTHDIFTEELGGSYAGATHIGWQTNRSDITGAWSDIGSQITSDDMFVQYSSGHGYESGLAVGVSYNDMRDAALGFDAKETIIFTMACKSGGLVDSFNRQRSRWDDFESQGKTLLVMSSSRTWENSATGPGRDEDEPDGPYGSAGSAFGHALWKALIGYADGYVDGVKDGYLSLDEIVEFTTWKTRRVGGHIPQVTGVYNAELIMNRVPSQEFLASLEGGTGNMTEEQVAALVKQLDQAMRIQ